LVEVVGHTGLFDYIEFVAEYAPYDLHDLDNLCRAAELYDLSTMIKVDQANRTFTAQRAVGSGFQSVLFADCRSAEDARECIRAVRPDTPEDGGYFGAATRRISYMSYGGGPEYVQALQEVVVVLMIEKQSAVDQLEEILSLVGVDMIQWGGVDYSMSIGKPGARTTPEVKAVERRVFETALKMGVPPRAEIGSIDQAKYYLDLGVRHFCIGTDIAILYNWLKENGEGIRRALSGA
jgi:4-hydroxy-2-oxoheptanedioate aldolase